MHLHPSLRIPACARRAVIHLESAKTANLDAPAVDQGRDHGSEYGVGRKLGVLSNQLGIMRGQLGDQFGFGHGGEGREGNMERLGAGTLIVA